MQQTAEILSGEVSVPQDSGKRSFPQLLVKGDDESHSAAGLLKSHMASALANHSPAILFERLDKLGARNDRLPRTHAGSVILRRTMPMSSDSPSSRSPST